MPPSDSPLPSNLQREIQLGRKFSLSEAIGREGGSFLKGSQAAVPRPLRAKAAINGWIDQYLQDPDGALKPSLKQWIRDDVRIGKYLDTPLEALRVIVFDMLANPEILYAFARQVAIELGHMNGERPHFQKPNTDAHPNVVYSHQSIRTQLTEFIGQLPPSQRSE
ncbi:MAG: hypothetical protein AAF821_23770 [Cyanobacteria bacterium P01_D01_bin.156]